MIAFTIAYCNRVDNFGLYLVYTFLLALLLQAAADLRVSAYLKFLVGLFVLGNWLKVTLHGIFQYPYVEPTGFFIGTVDQWDKYFFISIQITIALLISVGMNTFAPRVQKIKSGLDMEVLASKFFYQVSVLFIFLIYALNWQFGFYRIGIGRELDLPFGLNAPASFMVYSLAPMLTALLVTRSVVRRKRVTTVALLGIACVTIIAAISTYSRAPIATMMLPIVLGAYKTSHKLNGRPQSKAGLIIVLAPTTFLLLVAVSVLRILTYGNVQVITDTAVNIYFWQSLGLFVDRWIGAEGLMVSVSSNQSIDLFFNMLVENPAAGVQSIYQHLSNSHYLGLDLSNMTFLTLPGAFSLLSFSGSSAFVFFGVLMISGCGVFIEEIMKRCFRGHHAIIFLISGSFAYHFSQMIFPRLFMPFVVQVLFFATMLGLIYRRSSTARLQRGIKRNCVPQHQALG